MNYLFKEMSNGWKQPVPTNLEKDFGGDLIAYTLFLILLVKANNKEGVVTYKNKTIKLKRGQVLFGRQKFSKYLGYSPSGTHQVLKRLNQVHTKVTTEPSHNFTVVTIKNFDELTSISQPKKQQSGNQVATKWQPSDTPKSDKSDKSVKRKKNKKERKRKSFKEMPEIDKSMPPLTDDDLQESEKRELLRLGVIFQNPEDEKYYFVKNYFEKLS